MSATPEPWVLRLERSDIGHLPAWGSRYGRALCRLAAVEAALKLELKAGRPIYGPAEGRRACRVCVQAADTRQARTEAELATMGGR